MRTKPTPGGSSRRVSLRMIARAANVSVMTVSYALRGSPEVSASEARRIQKLAEAMHYRPDPLLTHLMQHLRSSRTVRSTSNLAVLTDLRADFVQRLLAGAEARAAKLGYTLDRIDPRTYDGRSEALTRALFARGMSGILLAPSDPTDCRPLIDWSRFAAVAMTYSVVEPRLHRVVPHHFDNASRTFALLHERGFRRIGFAMTPDMEFRTNQSYSGAYYRCVQLRGMAALPILLLDPAAKSRIATWYKRHRPDAVVLANGQHFRGHVLPALGEAICRRTPFATLDAEPEQGLAGIDQRFETIGSHAVDAVIAQIHRNERDVPAMPVVSMVEGQWREANGLYPLAD